jgi:FtsP/CotA-like multicopper oxidase with cupredoxin domain
VGKFLEFRVKAFAGTDLSMDPAAYEPGGLKMIPLPDLPQADLDSAIRREFNFVRGGGGEQPWKIETDGGDAFGMDARRISAAPNLGNLTPQGMGAIEIWTIVNGGGGWSHPIHIHFEEGQILKRDGQAPPEWEKWARKDVYRLGRMDDSGDSVEIALRFREFAGTYMEHCHNTQHEDHAMLLRWDVEKPGQVLLMPTPIPTWDGVEYEDSAALETFRTGN